MAEKVALDKNEKNDLAKKMTKREYSKYITDNKEEVIAKYKGIQPKNKKMKILTKKQKKELGIGKDEGRAELKYVRVSARKAKAVLDVIRGKDLDVAYGILKNTSRGASEFLLKLLKSAEANAINKPDVQMDSGSLYIAEAYANQGPTLKRIMPRAQGRANRIRKRTSHLTIVVREKKL